MGGKKARGKRRTGRSGLLDPSHAYPVRVIITDTGSDYRVEVSSGYLEGKAKPLVVDNTHGLGGRIMQWLNEESMMHGVRLGTVYATAAPKRDAQCRACRGNTILSGAASPEGVCSNCHEAGALFPGFAE